MSVLQSLGMILGEQLVRVAVSQYDTGETFGESCSPTAVPQSRCLTVSQSQKVILGAQYFIPSSRIQPFQTASLNMVEKGQIHKVLYPKAQN